MPEKEVLRQLPSIAALNDTHHARTAALLHYAVRSLPMFVGGDECVSVTSSRD